MSRFCNIRLVYSHILIKCLLSISCSDAQKTANIETLRTVQIIIRHGARTPLRPYPSDPYKMWPEGWGQLTKVGFEQQLELGKYIRQRYSGFVSSEYSRHEFYCVSSDNDRTIQSAQANLAGLFEHSSGAKHTLSNAIPIHTVPSDVDNWISTDASCTRLANILVESHASNPAIEEFEKENIEFIEHALEVAGFNSSASRSLLQVQDCIHSQIFYNVTLPKWATPDIVSKLNYFKAISFEWNMETTEMKRLLGGPLIGKLLHNFELSVNTPKGTLPQGVPFENEEGYRKIRLISGHDSTIVYLLISWGIYDRVVTPYATALMIELHEDQSEFGFYVEVYLKNDTEKEPYLLPIKECGSPCYLSKLIEFSDKFIPKDWPTECLPASKLQFSKSTDGASKSLNHSHTDSVPSETMSSSLMLNPPGNLQLLDFVVPVAIVLTVGTVFVAVTYFIALKYKKTAQPCFRAGTINSYETF